MAAGKKSVIRRWETQVGIGVSVVCFSVLGVFLGLRTGGEKLDTPVEVVQAEKVSRPEEAPQVKAVSRAEVVLSAEAVTQDEGRPLGIPDLDETNTEGSNPEGVLVRGPGGMIKGVLEGSSTVQYSAGSTPEEPPAIESSSEEMVAVKGTVAEGAAEDEAAASYPKTHTIEPNDTLMGIAKDYYGSVSKWALIYDANGLSDRDALIVGQNLVIPSPEGEVEQQPVVKKASLSGRGSPAIAHRVQQGDTLQKLAGVYYSDESEWKRIYDANKGYLSGRETLKPGEVLIIP